MNGRKRSRLARVGEVAWFWGYLIALAALGFFLVALAIGMGWSL